MKLENIVLMVVSALLAGLVEMTVLMSFKGLESPPIPPSVALTCTTAGLPDLAIVCKVTPWTSDREEIRKWSIDFGDGRQPGGADKLSSGNSDATEQDQPDEDLGSDRSFYWKYRDAGSYRVSVRVTDKNGMSARDIQDVTVALSEKLQDEINVQRVKIMAFKEQDESEQDESEQKGLEQSKEVPVAYRLGVHNFIFYEERAYKVEVKPDSNWRLTKCEEFERSSSRFVSYKNRPNPGTPEITEEGVAIFKFNLESSPFFSGSDDGYLYGTIRCWQIHEGNIEAEIDKELESEFPIDRLGIIEVDLGGESNPISVSGRREEEQIGGWELRLDGRNTYFLPWPTEYVHDRVRITPLDIPLIPLDIRRHKLYLRVELK